MRNDLLSKASGYRIANQHSYRKDDTVPKAAV